MKINPSPESAAAPSAGGVGKPVAGSRAAAPAAAAPAAADGAPVTVSPLARSLEPVSAGDGVDRKKVDAVREAIAKGTYKVDAEAIADKLLGDAQEILSRVRSQG
jgi:negative regulator of flagellin synthesis FlgM